MRYLPAILGLTACALLAANTACAQQFQPGDYYFDLSNIGNGGDGAGTGPAWVLPTGPTSATGGAIWVKTGSTYALNVQDVNIECDFRTASNQPTTVITDTCLISTGVAFGDVNVMGQYAYPGYFSGDDDATGWGNTHPDPSPYAQHLGQYWLPSTGPWVNFQFELKFWLGSEASFAAAAAAGEQVADTGWFTAGPLDLSNDNTFEYMPSVVLQRRLPGDANLDGKVDVNDLTIVLANFGQTRMAWPQGDFNGDGRVDVNDLTIVLSNYGHSLGSSAAGSASAVPEPGALALLAAGFAGLLAYALAGR